jgi:hypothetical protein
MEFKTVGEVQVAVALPPPPVLEIGEDVSALIEIAASEAGEPRIAIEIEKKKIKGERMNFFISLTSRKSLRVFCTRENYLVQDKNN